MCPCGPLSGELRDSSTNAAAPKKELPVNTEIGIPVRDRRRLRRASFHTWRVCDRASPTSPYEMRQANDECKFALLQSFNEEILHCLPRTMIRFFVVGCAFGIIVARVPISEAVNGAAIRH